jgi:hypothetical protein
MSAPITNLITKTSLIGIVPQFSANVDDNHFLAAANYANKRLNNLLPAALWTRLEAIYSLGTWSNATAYTTGQEIVYNNRGYVALQNGTNKNPSTETAYWSEIEVYSVWRDYLKPFLCWQAYNNFLIYGGMFVTQGGIKKHIDLNAEQASDEEKSRAVKRSQEMADILYMDFKKYMEDVKNTIDTVVYTFSNTTSFKPKIGIHIVKMIVLLLCFSKAYGQYPLPIVNEPKNYHFTKNVYIDGRFKVGYPTPTIARDIHFVADTIRLEGLDGTGTLLGIDINGDVTRVTGGAGGVTGLNPYEVLLADGSGDLFQTPNFQWSDEFGSDFLSITGVSPQISISEGAYGGTFSSKAAYLTDGTGVASELISGSLRFYDDDGGSITLSKYDGNTGTGYNYIFPATNGINGQSLRLNASLENEWFTPGSVTSFTFTDGSGFDGTVTNATTTPTLELTTTVGDNQVIYSNGGDLQGSSLFTWDDATDAEIFNATVSDFTVFGTSNYPDPLFQLSDGGSVSIGDFFSDVNSTYIYVEDPSELIQFRGDFYRFIDMAGAGDRLTYTDNDGDLLPVTLTANDFNFSSGTLSIDYTNGQTANTSTKGFLTDTDWDTFNNKVSFDINGKTEETSIAYDDEIPIYDISEGAINKITAENTLAGFNRPDVVRNYKFTYFNEFLNTVGTATGGNDIIATNSGTGAGTNNVSTGASNRVGLVRSTTGTTATGRTSPGTSSTACAFGGGTWAYEIEIKLAALSTVAQRYQLVIGFHDVQNASNQVDAIAFVYDEGGVSTGSAASANWQTLTSSNSTRTWTTTGTAVAAGWTNLRIEVNAAGNSVTYYVNGTAMGVSHTTNIPTGTARVAGFGYLMIKSIGTTASTMDVDYLFCESDFTTNR